MAEIIVFFIGLIISAILALLKITVWASLAWFVVPIPLVISLIIILIMNDSIEDLFN